MENTLFDGDYVVVQKNAVIEDGDIVVCDTERIYLDEDYIIKRYCEEKSSSGLYLIGDNQIESIDSRHFGEVPISSNKGVAVLKFSFSEGLKKL